MFVLSIWLIAFALQTVSLVYNLKIYHKATISVLWKYGWASLIVVNLGLLLRRATLIYEYGCSRPITTIPEVIDQLLVPIVSSIGLCIFAIALYSVFSTLEHLDSRKPKRGNGVRRKTHKSIRHKKGNGKEGK